MIHLNLANFNQAHFMPYLLFYLDKAHMTEVQLELLQLKRKANEKELKLQQDDKILSLEQELAWIREETMKLSGNNGKWS